MKLKSVILLFLGAVFTIASIFLALSLILVLTNPIFFPIWILLLLITFSGYVFLLLFLSIIIDKKTMIGVHLDLAEIFFNLGIPLLSVQKIQFPKIAGEEIRFPDTVIYYESNRAALSTFPLNIKIGRCVVTNKRIILETPPLYKTRSHFITTYLWFPNSKLNKGPISNPAVTTKKLPDINLSEIWCDNTTIDSLELMNDKGGDYIRVTASLDSFYLIKTDFLMGKGEWCLYHPDSKEIYDHFSKSLR